MARIDPRSLQPDVVVDVPDKPDRSTYNDPHAGVGTGPVSRREVLRLATAAERDGKIVLLHIHNVWQTKSLVMLDMLLHAAKLDVRERWFLPRNHD